MPETVKLLMVCLGNICRSPIAEGVTRHLAHQRGLQHRFVIDSAGTHAHYHLNSAPDPRAIAALSAKNIDIRPLRARLVTPEDFVDFDYLLAMDRANLAFLQNFAPTQHLEKVQLFLDYAPHLDTREVPDPYYAGSEAFSQVVELVEAAAAGLIETLMTRQAGP